MSYTIQTQQHPEIEELKAFIDTAFSIIEEAADKKFEEEDSGQSVAEWFATEELANYLDKGYLLEARNDLGELVGVAFVGKINPITWPDGRKTELFVLAVSPAYRKHGIGTALLKKAEVYAKEMGSKKLLINVHVFQEKTHTFYEKQGYTLIGTLKDYYDNGDAKFFAKVL
jgi:ribosomal protein S18 acetylase RimI-like enzyme